MDIMGYRYTHGILMNLGLDFFLLRKKKTNETTPNPANAGFFPSLKKEGSLE